MVFVSRAVRLDHLSPNSSSHRVNDIPVKTNSFAMGLPSRGLHHYDVIEPAEGFRGEVTIGSKKGNELVMRIQSSNPSIFNPRAAFDGKKNLFGPAYYFPRQTFQVDWTENPETDPKKRKVNVHMTHVNELSFENLSKYIQTQQHSNMYQNEVNLMINMLNVLANAAPRQKDGIMATGKSIFIQSEKRASGPLELWRGYFQTVRPAFDKMIINIDVTIGIVLPGDIRLEHVCATFLKCRNLQDLRNLRSDDFQKLRHFLKGVKVAVDIHQNKPPKVIKDLVQNAGGFTFDRNGEAVTVSQHFRETHNISIQNSTLGVRLGTAGVFPITVCKTVKQFYKNRAPSEVVSAALEFTPPDPTARANEIERAFSHFQYDSGFLSGAGIMIDKRPQTTMGRFLTQPTIQFSNGVRDFRRRNDRPGVWDVMNQTLVRPARIPLWIVVDFAGAKRDMLQSFVNDLMQAMVKLGIQVSQPATMLSRPPQGSIDRILSEIVDQYSPNMMILAILPDQAEELYRKVKRFGDIQKGVATQCVRWSSKLTRDIGGRKINQYHNNLILKINPKMGGTNFSARLPVLDQIRKAPFMIIGADVSHPGPGSQMPSVASLVASYDQDACQYAASIRLQASRVEVIEEFGEMFKGLLDVFRAKNNVVPQQIYIFRDGVSEGEFLNVVDAECRALGAVIKSTYPDKHQPKLLYIVVGKRHHVRFFPSHGQSAADPRGNGNFPSGLVVDEGVVHPRFCDFYLQSQPGLKGTSIPSHYTILRNDIGIPVVAVQELAYALCHCYSRSTRSVKIPAPVYYADLVCRRAKFHYNEHINDYSVSSVSGDDSAAHLDYYRHNFDAVESRLHDRMYFV